MSMILRTDVTAVKFHNSYIFAGIGNFVYVYSKKSTRLLKRIQVLEGQKIYGFVPGESEGHLLVFGGKQYSVVSLASSVDGDEEVEVTRVFPPVVTDDWIHAGVWIDDGTVALLTAHNVVQKWNTTNQTLISSNLSKNNSILYSGLLLKTSDSILVFAGTVFSEVILHFYEDEKPLHRLIGHRGVIFSISCDPQKETIATTSDDRSVRIWSVNNKDNHPNNSRQYWENANIICKHEVYGHLARVMRNCITKDYIVSVGEDSAICFWSFEGKLVRKLLTHQNGAVWSVDSNNDSLVTGGGDCGVILHPLTIADDYCNAETLNLNIGTPKKIQFTARNNLIILNDDNLIYYDTEAKIKTEFELNHTSSYKLLTISSCKQIVGVADMNGKLDIFVENCKDTALLNKIVDTKLEIGNVLSMNWAGNRHLVICADKGNVTILASKGNATEVYAEFALPPCKERWLTASAMDVANKIIVLGDRCGNIHIYKLNHRNPIKTFNKVHGRYGPTTINIRNNEIVTTGRDGTIKYFEFNKSTDQIKHMHDRELDFKWVEKFLDKNGNIICGFQERAFIVFDIKTNSKILEITCGGGHRSWDAIRYFNKINGTHEELITLIYIKNSDINFATFQLSKVRSKTIVNGSHAKEINCLKTVKTSAEDKTYYISGGEDTTLRISSVDKMSTFKDEFIFKQLSNIRALKICRLKVDKIFILSAGGRAQICIKSVQFYKANCEEKFKTEQLIDYMIKGTDKERKGNQNWRNCTIDFDPETRIMDLDFIKIDNDNLFIFAGCSDAYLRVYRLTTDLNNIKFEPVKEIKHNNTCILKTEVIKTTFNEILVTCTTRGEVTFWELKNKDKIEEFDIKPVFNTKTNKSGINCVSTKVIDDKILIATGGDDNALHLTLLDIKEDSINILNKWNSDKLHCSQITGVILLQDFVVTTAIDQRISLLNWKIVDNEVKCGFIDQVYSDVADIQGMDLMDDSSDSIHLCVFGKGLEEFKLEKKHK